MLTDGELTLPSTITLTEAITTLAFKEPVAAGDIGRAIADGRWGANRQNVSDQLAAAAKAICDAGVAEKIECTGRKSCGLPKDLTSPVGPFVTLTREDYREYRLYVEGFDALWKKAENKNGEEPDVTDEFANAFAGLASLECFGDIVIVRETFETRFPTSPSGSPAPFTNAEIDAWIRATLYTGMKKARDAFMKELRAKGLSATFEVRWNAIKQNPVGRPRVR